MTTAAGGEFELRAPGWSVIFQRRVLDGDDATRSANRGALPQFILASRRRDRLMAVPLGDEESLWIAVTCSRNAVVRGWTVDGDRLGVATVSGLGSRSVLLAVDAVRRRGRTYPIDRRTARVARSGQRRSRVSLVVTISAHHRTETLHVVLVTPRMFTRLSGRPAPGPSSPEQAYAGWLLP